MIERTIITAESGKRLHRYLCQLMPNLPLGQVYKMIAQGKVRINKKRKKQNYILQEGDVVILYLEDEVYNKAAKGPKKEKFIGINTNIDILYEDKELLVVNKPAGLLVHPDQKQFQDTLIGRIHAYLYHKSELNSSLFTPATANRLDRNTSGIVLIGKTAGMLHDLNQTIKRHELQKYYLTIVRGCLPQTGHLKESLIRDETKKKTHIAALDSLEKSRKEAETWFRTLQVNSHYSLVEVKLGSGRTHQIRAHFAHLGFPLLGDIKYGGPLFGTLNHQLLHAWKVILVDGHEFKAPIPHQMKEIMSELNFTEPNEQGEN